MEDIKDYAINTLKDKDNNLLAQFLNILETQGISGLVNSLTSNIPITATQIIQPGSVNNVRTYTSVGAALPQLQGTFNMPSRNFTLNISGTNPSSYTVSSGVDICFSFDKTSYSNFSFGTFNGYILHYDVGISNSISKLSWIYSVKNGTFTTVANWTGFGAASSTVTERNGFVTVTMGVASTTFSIGSFFGSLPENRTLVVFRSDNNVNNQSITLTFS